ncbi:MAG: RdgB/HAM1 family non-canonical purine NTP pyrophosphatase [Campylobacterota bacterium]|nr:RdgB/HAM1 family non-canonical purine NTP pyrophosphatase [Campylobacterota bacterium]
MQLILASSNKGKVKEFTQMCEGDIIPFSDMMEPFEIIEDGDTFAQNALIKARTIYEKLGEAYLVIADDSGISVPLLGGEPGIYSARYAGEGVTDRENLNKLIGEIKIKEVHKTAAYYTAAIAIVCQYGEYVVHGWMFGDVINERRGDKGFGYDPIFIPEGYTQTLGELDNEIKSKISHRAKALKLAKPILQMLLKKEKGV